MTIQKIIQEEVNKLASEHWADDPCKPVFTVSIYRQKLILTCKHGSSAFSHALFPDGDMNYGLPLLKDTMDGLYNRTM